MITRGLAPVPQTPSSYTSVSKQLSGAIIYYKTAKRLQKIHKEMKKGENILIVKKPSINLENEINWSKKRESEKKERSYGSMNHGDI